MIVLIGGEKGGTGKSTLATNLCAYLAVRGEDTLLLDTDGQPTSANWAAERSTHPDLGPVHCVQRTGNLYPVIADLRKRYGNIIVDAGGRDSEEMRSAMALCDKFYSPAKASQSDLWTMEHLAKVVRLAKAVNPRLVTRVVLSMAPTNPRVNEEQEAVAMLEEYKEDLPLSACVLHERKTYRDATRQGKGVVEMSNSQAANEITLLAKEIFGGTVQKAKLRSVAGAA